MAWLFGRQPGVGSWTEVSRATPDGGAAWPRLKASPPPKVQSWAGARPRPRPDAKIPDSCIPSLFAFSGREWSFIGRFISFDSCLNLAQTSPQISDRIESGLVLYRLLCAVPTVHRPRCPVASRVSMAFVAAGDGIFQTSPAPSQGTGFMRPGNVSGNSTSAVEATAQRPFRARRTSKHSVA